MVDVPLAGWGPMAMSMRGKYLTRRHSFFAQIRSEDGNGPKHAPVSASQRTTKRSIGNL